jgi:hypothetical protein
MPQPGILSVDAQQEDSQVHGGGDCQHRGRGGGSQTAAHEMPSFAVSSFLPDERQFATCFFSVMCRTYPLFARLLSDAGPTIRTVDIVRIFEGFSEFIEGKGETIEIWSISLLAVVGCRVTLVTRAGRLRGPRRFVGRSGHIFAIANGAVG